MPPWARPPPGTSGRRSGPTLGKAGNSTWAATTDMLMINGAAANRVKEKTGQKGKALFHPIRVALTGEGGGPELEPDIAFWVAVFTDLDSDQGVLHDTRNLAAIYERIDIPAKASRAERQRRVQDRREHYRAILERLASGKRSSLSAEESRVLALWPGGVANATLAEAAHDIRRLAFRAMNLFDAAQCEPEAFDRADHFRNPNDPGQLPADAARVTVSTLVVAL